MSAIHIDPAVSADQAINALNYIRHCVNAAYTAVQDFGPDWQAVVGEYLDSVVREIDHLRLPGERR